ncbi:DUF5331 domain-containing protein [Coleofasciculus sp. FACHB-1120]|uniref:DUF5331 domain-containing protein n=1 Tax=Coleofasciculus sp. FACHB-1120 TaxID=2692783 RepID=UPI0016837B3C|nr:DUF5331 domain-containing protein [Coleofasciculus sp. FACHB-1120]MBD2742270.1 hypothetical protein [Coleofasciculus sp. FACHB-1120]
MAALKVISSVDLRNADALITVLGLHFDPDLEIAKRSEDAVKKKDTEIVALLADSE